VGFLHLTTPSRDSWRIVWFRLYQSVDGGEAKHFGFWKSTRCKTERNLICFVRIYSRFERQIGQACNSRRNSSALHQNAGWKWRKCGQPLGLILFNENCLANVVSLMIETICRMTPCFFRELSGVARRYWSTQKKDSLQKPSLTKPWRDEINGWSRVARLKWKAFTVSSTTLSKWGSSLSKLKTGQSKNTVCGMVRCAAYQQRWRGTYRFFESCKKSWPAYDGQSRKR